MEVAQPASQPKAKPKVEKVIIKQEDSKELTEVIASSQNKVYTVYTTASQGSAFLINQNGDLLTNAHVIDGNYEAEIYDMQGNLFYGTVIGFSNDTDIAVIRVPQLAGKEPLSLEETEKALIGEEVIALGSPHGYSNTATLGYVSGVDRTFFIEPHSFESVYQISAPIAPGSSGGPLLSKKTGKVIAINSARHSQEAQIGFSIPMMSIMDLIKDWIENPLSFDSLMVLYDENFEYYSETKGDGYFDDGYYEEEYEGYDQWSYDSETFSDGSQFYPNDDNVISYPNDTTDEYNAEENQGYESPNDEEGFGHSIDGQDGDAEIKNQNGDAGEGSEVTEESFSETQGQEQE